MPGRPQVPPTAAGLRQAERAAKLARRVEAAEQKKNELQRQYRHALLRANEGGLRIHELEEIVGRGGTSIGGQIAQAREELRASNGKVGANA